MNRRVYACGLFSMLFGMMALSFVESAAAQIAMFAVALMAGVASVLSWEDKP